MRQGRRAWPAEHRAGAACGPQFALRCHTPLPRRTSCRAKQPFRNSGRPPNPAPRRPCCEGGETMAEIKIVGVVGAGQMGAGIARVCAAAGYTVLLNED